MSKGYNHGHKIGDYVENDSEGLRGEVTSLEPFTVNNGPESNPHMWRKSEPDKNSDHPFFKKF